MHRAIKGKVYAMGRPARPAGERHAVRFAARSLDGSVARRARALAAAVVQAYLDDEARKDALDRALFEARQRFDPDPIHGIATASESDVPDKFAKERLARFEARGCQQLGERDWQAETRAISAKVEQQLARRFRNYLS